MKYIIGVKLPGNYWEPCVFSEDITHLHVAMAMEKDGIVIHSAGYCRIHDGKVETYSESKSIGIKPHKNDALLLTLFLTQGLSGLDLFNMAAFLIIQMTKGVDGAKGILPSPKLRVTDEGTKKNKPRRRKN